MQKKKSLGQHFLHSKHYLELIADSAQIKKGEAVLEVGPGEGALTGELLARGAKVIAVEKDARLIPLLQEKFAKEIASNTFILVEGDIMEMDTAALGLKEYKVVANIPYYISGAIFKKFLSSEHQPSSMTLLVQKEVAERIAREEKGSILSLSVKAYCAPKYIKTVPAGAFAPPPKVDSAILLLEAISRANFSSTEQEVRFFELVRAGFGQKRKLLKRNLEAVLGEKAEEALVAAEIPPNARAEDVRLEGWLKLNRF